MGEETTPKQEEQPEELITFKEFLEEYPISSFQNISGYYETEWSSNRSYYVRSTPILHLYCGGKCDGFRNFEGKWAHSRYLSKDTSPDDTLVYTCRDCNEYEKHFFLICYPHGKEGEGKGQIAKVGELPELHIKLPSNLPKLFGPDYDYFIKGLKCEKQGLGVGAYSYYRRVVENQKNRLFDEIIKVSKKLSAKKDIIEALEAAKQETQFTKALDMVKETMPESLLVDGHNPFKLLHKALSIGIHNQPDSECLKISHNIRMVLIDLCERIKIALSEQNELHSAVSSLLNFNNENT